MSTYKKTLTTIISITDLKQTVYLSKHISGAGGWNFQG